MSSKLTCLRICESFTIARILILSILGALADFFCFLVIVDLNLIVTLLQYVDDDTFFPTDVNGQLMLDYSCNHVETWRVRNAGQDYTSCTSLERYVFNFFITSSIYVI